jgi:protein-S-isoprenylcysteine O-methyltransferase Ste14
MVDWSRLSRWTGIGLQLVSFPVVVGLAPWALSVLGARHGWIGGEPGIVNLVGLIPVAAGFYTFLLCTREHFLAAPSGWLLERTPHYPTPSYLLTSGPYRYSCNPIYLAELATWLGWIVFYGSFVIAGAFAAVAVLVGPLIVPREELGLEARFGTHIASSGAPHHDGWGSQDARTNPPSGRGSGFRTQSGEEWKSRLVKMERPPISQ